MGATQGLIRWPNVAGSQTILSASGTGAGAAFGKEARNFTRWTAYSTGTFVATVKVQGTIDGTNWFDIGDVSTAGANINYQYPLFAIRGNCTAYTSGSFTVEATASP